MPYAPGVQSIGGQLLGQGIQQGLTGLAQGLREYKQNKVMAAQGIAEFEGAAQNNPDMLQYVQREDANPQVKSAFNKLQSGGSVGFKDAALLAQFAKSYVGNKQQAQQSQIQAAQLRAMAEQQAARDRAIQLIQSSQNAIPGISGKEALQAASDPMVQYSGQVYRATGQLPAPSDLERLSAAGMKLNQLQKATPQEFTTSTGAKALFSPSTGAFSVLPATAEQQGAAEAAKAEAEVNAKSAGTLLDDVSTTAENARHTNASVDRIMALYDAGVQSGWGQGVLTQARAAFGRFGLGKDGLGNQQQFEKELNNLVLERGRELMRGSGSVSNYERQTVEKASANAGLDPSANKAILGVMKQIGERNIKLDEMRSEMEDRGVSNVQIARELRKARDKMPINLEPLVAIGEKEAEAAPVKIISIKQVK